MNKKYQKLKKINNTINNNKKNIKIKKKCCQ